MTWTARPSRRDGRPYNKLTQLAPGVMTPVTLNAEVNVTEDGRDLVSVMSRLLCDFERNQSVLTTKIRTDSGCEALGDL